MAWNDPTICCPLCSSEDRLTFTSVPEHRREYVVDGESHTDHMPAMRDYRCLNCDAQWIMPEDQNDFR